ncbi:L-aspartate oxidase [Collinsella ihumii]|uniref:L-aspartate oxidase n=1 Tax=Collinsella ihumii TaxID=1720204 RepID=UPI0025AB0E22|nr:FAD-binding protein [Collinsella ihumii]MDN0054622.1 FAD-binding protein [Collinsella ihumii]
MAPTDTEARPSDIACDVVIVGCGVAGLYTALNLPRTTSIVMLSKGAIEECDSMLAQGGICVLPEADDFEAYREDTLRAGHYENRLDTTEIMIRDSRTVVNDLVACGVDLERDETGALAFTREGAHSRPRICYHEDVTGQEITTKLLACVRRLPNVRILEHVAMVDLIDGQGGACAGVVARPVEESRSCERASELAHEAVPTFAIGAGATVLACGGIGGLYERSTNYPQLTGDACDIAAAHGAVLEHMDYVQIHPTSFYTGEGTCGRAFLISESCRGEGAILINRAGERFCDELQPRDVVSQAIFAQMEADGMPYVRLSFERIPHEVIRGHFAHICERCLEAGYDICREPVPVVPAQHYFMGGIHVDTDAATGVAGLYAVGETSCTGVHGKNRLASNSLLEALVFARRAAYRIACGKSLAPETIGEPALDGRHRPCGIPDAAIDALCAPSSGEDLS